MTAEAPVDTGDLQGKRSWRVRRYQRSQPAPEGTSKEGDHKGRPLLDGHGVGAPLVGALSQRHRCFLFSDLISNSQGQETAGCGALREGDHKGRPYGSTWRRGAPWGAPCGHPFSTPILRSDSLFKQPRASFQFSSWPGAVPAIHVFAAPKKERRGCPGLRPGMTVRVLNFPIRLSNSHQNDFVFRLRPGMTKARRA